jgi:hypothetical protein
MSVDPAPPLKERAPVVAEDPSIESAFVFPLRVAAAVVPV